MVATLTPVWLVVSHAVVKGRRKKRPPSPRSANNRGPRGRSNKQANKSTTHHEEGEAPTDEDHHDVVVCGENSQESNTTVLNTEVFVPNTVSNPQPKNYFSIHMRQQQRVSSSASL